MYFRTYLSEKGGCREVYYFYSARPARSCDMISRIYAFAGRSLYRLHVCLCLVYYLGITGPQRTQLRYSSDDPNMWYQRGGAKNGRFRPQTIFPSSCVY